MESIKPVTLLVGHRGVGKTTYLGFLKSRRPEIQTYDLDREIEKRSGKSVAEIFQEGEAVFRKLETETLHALVEDAKTETFVAVGAGYQGAMPEGVSIHWLRRSTDKMGRSFLNRPRLNQRLTPFEEFQSLYRAREARYKKWSEGHEIFLPEGDENGEFVLPEKIPFDLTLMPEGFGLVDARKLELREDLLSKEKVQDLIDTVMGERLIFSKRTKAEWPKLDQEITVDWPVELGPVHARADILSLHERFSDISTTVKRFGNFAKIQKLAIEIKTFNELFEGHQWWLQDPAKRAFMPRSQDGRWRWYRSLFGPKMPLHFVREGEGSALDQPFVWQTALQPEMKNHFAAVLGSPIEHSRSPLEHLAFFRRAQIPFVAIPIEENEFEEAWSVLTQLGLKFAAVTSPLKTQALKAVTKLDAEAEKLQAVNTLTITKDQVLGHNTDVLALKALKDEIPQFENVMIWGGGGVKSAVQSVWPKAKQVSAREGLKDTAQADLVIWATGRSREFKFPTADLTPKLVLDLNYTEDSPGLEWAVMRQLPYQSGLRMFKLQAEFQRQIWRDYL